MRGRKAGMASNDPKILGYQTRVGDPTPRILSVVQWVTITKIATIALLGFGGVYLFLCLLLVNSNGWLLKMAAASGWAGIGSALIGVLRLRASSPYRISWLNVGVLLMWGRFWLDVLALMTVIIWWKTGGPFTFDYLIVLIPAVLIFIVTGLVIRLNLLAYFGRTRT
jgi:hypothetical protein